MTLRLKPDTQGLTHAVGLLSTGQLLAFPTETVYGLGADATNSHAVAGIFHAKNRPNFNPLIVHVGSIAAAARIARLEGEALDLAKAFWPGPLTLVLPLLDRRISPLVRAGLPTVAVRVPANPLARQLLVGLGRPVAAPSANPSGKISPTRPEHVLDSLSGKIAAVLDGGPCGIGVESTIIGFQPEPVLLRPGGLPVEAIEAALRHPLGRPAPSSKPNAPGQLASHYAPAASLRLEATDREPDEALLGFGPVAGDLNLSKSGNLVEAAANLFHMLRALDLRHGRIAVAPIPDHGLGRAINDRLRRAAAPR